MIILLDICKTSNGYIMISKEDDSFEESNVTVNIILVDEASNSTVGAVMIL